MATTERPLSPHLQIYKPQITSVLSITHRGTGVFLSLGAIFLSYWLFTIVNGPEAYNNFRLHIQAWYGNILLFLWIFCLFYHLCNGIRHLYWDIGYGFDIRTTYLTGYIVIAVSLFLTITTWYLT